MELQSLLKRLRRSCRSSPDVGAGAPSLAQRPPDEGSAALGYQLGSAFASALLGCAPATSSSDINDLRKVGCDIIDALSAAPSSSFAVGYFSGVHMTLCDDQISATALFAALEAILSWCLTLKTDTISRPKLCCRTLLWQGKEFDCLQRAPPPSRGHIAE